MHEPLSAYGAGDWAGRPAANSLTRRDFPTPASPMIVTSRASSVVARATVLGSDRVELRLAPDQRCDAGTAVSWFPTGVSGGRATADEDVSALRPTQELHREAHRRAAHPRSSRDDLSCLDRDTERKDRAKLGLQCLGHTERPFGVVLLRRRRAERGQDPAAGARADHPAGGLDLRAGHFTHVVEP